MMLRVLVLVLMLMNLGYLAWGQGWLLPYGLGPVSQREPQRLARQIHPEAISIVRADGGASAPSDGRQDKLVCLQSEAMNLEQVDKLRVVLQGTLPAQAWTLDEFTTRARWIVYMGKYNDAAEVDKKRAELVRLGVVGESPQNPALALGIVLGTFDLQAQADAALKTLVERGVRSARVVQDLPAVQRFRLRLPAVDETLNAQLPVVRAALPAQALQPCTAASAPD
jgi:hypothetical protein